MTYEEYTTYRDNAKLTDYQVAQKSGIKSQIIYQWKKNGGGLAVKTYKKIGETLNIPLKTLYDT